MNASYNMDTDEFEAGYTTRYFVFRVVRVPYWVWRWLPLWRGMELS